MCLPTMFSSTVLASNQFFLLSYTTNVHFCIFVSCGSKRSTPRMSNLLFPLLHEIRSKRTISFLSGHMNDALRINADPESKNFSTVDNFPCMYECCDCETGYRPNDKDNWFPGSPTKTVAIVSLGIRSPVPHQEPSGCKETGLWSISQSLLLLPGKCDTA